MERIKALLENGKKWRAFSLNSFPITKDPHAWHKKGNYINTEGHIVKYRRPLTIL